MGKLNNRIIVFGFALLALPGFSGCTPLYQRALASMRQPGEQIETSPDQVWDDLECAKRQRPFVRVESMEVVPEMMNPGDRVNYRIIYAMCPLNPSEVVKARVLRKILFKGEQVASNVNDALELKPGRWVVDSFFTLPPESPVGVYSLEVNLETPDRKTQKKVRSFVVSNENYLMGG